MTILGDPATHWRREQVRRVAPLIDGAAYFAALAQALEQARRSVLVLGWDIHADLVLDPEAGHETLAALLARLTAARPNLEVRLLIWDWILPCSFDRQLLPRWRFGPCGPRVRLELDDHHPPGGCVHEKLVVIDGQLAFVGGIDLTNGRWDLPEHRGYEPRRGIGDGEPRPPFHDLMLMVEGPAATALETLARERWQVATGELVPPAAGIAGSSAWPSGIAPWLEEVEVAIARTRPAYGPLPAAREIEALLTGALRHGRHSIYIESQYLTAEAISASLADAARARSELEAVIVTPARCEAMIETAVMDVGRARFIRRLRRTFAPGRLRVLHPVVTDASGQEAPINVHSKLVIVDDRFVCVGSANLARRSMGLDTEVALAIEAGPGDHRVRTAIRGLRDRLLAEHLERPAEEVSAAIEAAGNRLIPVIDRNGGRLRELRLSLPTWLRLLAQPASLADLDEPLTPARIADQLAPPRRRRVWTTGLSRLTLLLTLVVGLGLLAYTDAFGLREQVDRAFALAEQWRGTPLAAAIVLLTFVLGSLVLVPITLMIAATAATMGPVTGFLLALTGSVAAAGTTFVLGRALGRERVRQLAGRRVNAVMQKVAGHGVLAVALLRLVPVAPFTVVNVVAGVSAIRLRDFVLGSGLGLMPGIALATLFGNQLGSWLRQPDAGGFVMLVACLALLLAAGAWLRRWGGNRVSA